MYLKCGDDPDTTAGKLYMMGWFVIALALVLVTGVSLYREIWWLSVCGVLAIVAHVIFGGP